MTDGERLTTEAILDALANPTGELPREAVQQALDRWDDFAPHFLAALETSTSPAKLLDEQSSLLFFSIYLTAHRQDTRAYRPVCRIASQDNRLYSVISDGVTEDFSVILIRLFDGDPAPIRMIVEAEDADEFVREAALTAIAWLTATGRLDRAEMAAYLRDLHGTLRPQETNQVWVGWQDAVATLNLTDLVPLVEDAFSKGLVDEDVTGLENFRSDLRKAAEATTPAEAFTLFPIDEHRLDDIIGYLSTWTFKKDNGLDNDTLDALSTLLAAKSPLPLDGISHRNPLRDVGRNDLCPCGSGKKFKKCHLGREDELTLPSP